MLFIFSVESQPFSSYAYIFLVLLWWLYVVVHMIPFNLSTLRQLTLTNHLEPSYILG